MNRWKKSLAGVVLSVSMGLIAAPLVGAQEPASLTGYVSLCEADLSACEDVQGINVYFDVNGLDNERVVQTNASGEASIEVSTGDQVEITIDPAAIPGASISSGSQAGYVVDPVMGDEDSFNFIFVKDKAGHSPTATVVPAAMPASGAGPQFESGSNAMLVVLAGGGALLASATGLVIRKRGLR